jgi:AraC-like DNA-binding protein
VEERSATHTVDFENYTLAPGDLLWVRAGQVHVFADDPLPAGHAVLFQPDFLFPGTQAAAFADDRFGPTYWQLREPEPAAREAFGQLHAAYDTTVVRPNHDYSEVLKHLLSVLLLRLHDISPTHEMPRGRQDETFARLRNRIERDFARHHQVLHYAKALNHSPRTLSRAALGATGSTAKQLIDQRLILEAKRILAYTTLPVGAIAYELGFDDASNFSSFFIRHTQISPSAFRAELASTGP